MEILFVFFLQFVAGIAAFVNLILAGVYGGLSGFMRDLLILAGAFLLWIAGMIFLSFLPCSNSQLEVVIFALSGIGGFIPFGILISKAWKEQRKKEIPGYLFGSLAMLIHSGALFFVICDTCLLESTFNGEKLFQENLIDGICHFMIPGTVLFFLPVFALLFPGLCVWNMFFQNEQKNDICRGYKRISGIFTIIFFLLGLGLLAYISRYV